jgi:hypothetical protein
VIQCRFVANTKTFDRNIGRSGKCTYIHIASEKSWRRYREIARNPGMYREVGDGRFRAVVRRFGAVPRRSERY